MGSSHCVEKRLKGFESAAALGARNSIAVRNMEAIRLLRMQMIYDLEGNGPNENDAIATLWKREEMPYCKIQFDVRQKELFVCKNLLLFCQ